MELLKRDQLNIEETWDLTRLFKTEEEYEKAVENLIEMVDTFEKSYKGQLNSSKKIVKALIEYEKILILNTYVNTYANLSLSVDQQNEDNVMRYGVLRNKINNISNKLSFLENEIIKNDVEILEDAIKQDSNFTKYLSDLIAFKPHRLSDAEENLLTSLSPILSQPYTNYDRFKFADMDFGKFHVNNKEYNLSFNNFESNFEYEPNKEVRHAAFDAFYDTLRRYESGLANNYYTHVLKEHQLAKLRGFDSTIEYLLFNQDVSIDMYNRQIDVIMEELSKPMRKYANLIKETYQLETMTFADLKLPLDLEYEPKVSIEEAKNITMEALSFMGEDYSSLVEQALNNRWIDFPQNIGKSTGGFCSSPYRKGSFVLLNWNNQMDEAFVLAHELGHAGHFHYASNNQSLFNSRASLYFIEAPSTMNELLMAKHFMSKSKDNRFKRWVLSTIISRTYYHNFVTHLLEAHYQREVYRLVDNQKPITGKTLTNLKVNTLKQFWGDDVEIRYEDGLTWMRQPHYFMGLYPYTYSAGLTVATNVVEKIDNNELEPNDWINVLKAGGSKKPLELAKMVNVDLSTDKPLKSTIKYIENIIDEIIKLTKEINKEK